MSEKSESLFFNAIGAICVFGLAFCFVIVPMMAILGLIE